MRLLICATLAVATPFLVAQDPAKPTPAKTGQDGPAFTPPTPGPEHTQLKKFEGNWDVTVKTWEKSGSEPTTTRGIDESKFACNGMWLVTTVTGVPGSQPFQGFALNGFDQTQKKFVGVWVDSTTSAPSTTTGEFDNKNTFNFRGEMATPVGTLKMRSTCVFQGADNFIKTTFATGADGKEFQSMELTFIRHKGAVAAPAAAIKGAAAMPDPHDPMHKHLTRFTGTWDGFCKNEMPGAPVTNDKFAQTDTLFCNDLWVQTHANGTFNNAPFEGIGLFGYDTFKKQFTSFWFDGMASFFMKSTGSCDKDGKTFTLHGNCVGMDGKPVTTEETTTFDGNKRTMVMKMKSADGKDGGTMTLSYTRK